MKKNDWKYFIDVILFITFSSILVTGLMLALIIPGGRGGNKYFLGLHRHEWGDIHFYLSLLLIAIVSLHILYNRTWVVSSTRRYFNDHWKSFLWGVGTGWIFVLLVAWVLVFVMKVAL